MTREYMLEQLPNEQKLSRAGEPKEKKKLAHLYERQDQGSESDKFKVASGKTKKLNAQE